MKSAWLTLGLVTGIAVAVAVYFLIVPMPRDAFAVDPATARQVWTEVNWPFPIDQWGRGRAFKCNPTDCGSEVRLYLRAKLGSCNCEDGVADDEALDRMGDLELVARKVSPLGNGRPINIAWMKGRLRAYEFAEGNSAGRAAISVAFNDRCDMIVATVVMPHDQPAKIEPGVLEFLNSKPVLHWAELALGI
jgi:hypothetical protein